MINKWWMACSACLLLIGCTSAARVPEAVRPTETPTPSLEIQRSTPEAAPTRMPTATMIPTSSALPASTATVAPLAALPQPNWPNLAYIPGGHPNQKLDVYLPETGEGPFPTFLAIHGGGFRSRSKLHYSRMAQQLTEMGYAVVSTGYRFAPAHTFPAQVKDVSCALAWVQANRATYGFDPDQIYVMGDSAGGYLAAMLGTVDPSHRFLEGCPHQPSEDPWIAGVVVIYGFYDFSSIEGFPQQDVKMGLEPFWGAAFEEIPAAKLDEMSPRSWVDGGEPRFLLIHGVEDRSVPSWMSEDFAALLQEKGVDVELLLLETGHGFISWPITDPANVQSLAAIHSFLEAGR